jgi:DNA-binding CsgD family transcriptional regulator
VVIITQGQRVFTGDGSAEERQVKRERKVGRKRESVMDPALERPLLSLHRAMNVDALCKAVQHVISAAVPNRLIGLTLQHSPVLPVIARWTRPMAEGFFTTGPLGDCIAAQRKRFVRLGSFYSNRGALIKSAFYRRYMAPQKCAHGVGLLFWKGPRLVCVIVIMRTAAQGAVPPKEMTLLRRLYPQFSTALNRLESIEREHSVRKDFEEFLRALPLPTILLRWNLNVIYQNRAARDFCSIWEKGREQARLTKAISRIPSEILDRCRLLKKQSLQSPNPRRIVLKKERVPHPRWPNLRATIHIKQLNSAGVARPHFLIECEDLCRHPGQPAAAANSRLPQLVHLTGREQEVTRFVCDGRSNQEIADATGLSLPTVKKHLHQVFRKLEVPSRNKLMSLML